MDSAAEIGSTANHYQVLAKLATGGMAEIFLARSAGVAAVQRHVVLKRVLRERASDMNFIRMFLDEARLAAQLQHPNVAQVYDVGKLGDSYFFTMEYVHGETVRAVLGRAHDLRRSPPLACVLAIAAGAAAGLHHAHTRIGIDGRPLGIVHRDVSPSNLMVGYDGSVKVVDFGVAKAADRVHETHSGAVKGKISYLSPEQARGQKLDQRSDLFSLGIVLWELLTVERLYKHDSDFATMSAIIHETPAPPSSRRRDLPPEVDGLVLRALAKDPADRFQTAEELGEAIERVAVRNNATLSAASLSRFIRELFGTRPEPWVSLSHANPKGPEIVTVTSEPLPAELPIPLTDPIDRRLANLVDLSTVFSDSSATSPAPQRFPSASPGGAVMPLATPRGGSPLPQTGDASISPVTASLTALPAALAPSAPRPIAAVPPLAEPSATDLVPRGWQRWRWQIAAVVAAVGIAVVLAILIARGGRREVAQPTAAAPVATPDAAQVVAIEPPDAAEAVVDAAEPVAADAAPQPDAALDLDERVVAACIANPKFDREQCALAACRTGDATNAKKWGAKATAKVVAACAKNGIRLAPPPPSGTTKPPPAGSAKPPAGSATGSAKECDDPFKCRETH